jgi:hypothetical protein
VLFELKGNASLPGHGSDYRPPSFIKGAWFYGFFFKNPQFLAYYRLSRPVFFHHAFSGAMDLYGN